MSRTRLVALDVDGTLMSYDGVISADVRSTLTGLVEAGVHVVLSTGRSAHSAVAVAQDLGLTHGWVVCSNGAVTARLDPDVVGGWTVARSVTFDAGPALRAIAMEIPDALFAVEHLGVGFLVSAPFPDGELTGDTTVVPFDDLASSPVTRVVIRAPEATPEEFHDIVERVGLHEVTYAVGWSAWLDLTPGGVSKASALEEVRRDLAVEPYETLAIGDGENDVEMLRWAACGVAMGHAGAVVRAAADEVTGTIEDDGAVAVLRRVLS